MSTIPGKSPAVKLPPQVASGRDLLLEHLGKLLTVEETLAKKLLPSLAQEEKDEDLKTLLQEHLGQTREHVTRVKEAFSALQEDPAGRPAIGLDGLATERESTVADVVPGMRSGVNCEAAMGTEHYEINTYDAAIRLADALKAKEVGQLLRANLDEEVAALAKLAKQADRLAKLAVDERAIKH
jgi:ferritin-like metal-binding protein YciE